MQTFLALNEFLVEVSVVIAAISSYLIINKLWSRRARRDVAESISISAALLGLAPTAGRPGFVLHLSAWLWLTVLFANFAEAVGADDRAHLHVIATDQLPAELRLGTTG